MFFDLNEDDYLYYNNDKTLDISQVDIEVASPTRDPNFVRPTSRFTVDLDIWDNFENQYQALLNNIKTDYRVSNVKDRIMHDDRILFCDFLFNRTKAYYSNHAFRPTTRKWYWVHDKAYQIPDYPEPGRKNKIYVAPNKTWNEEWRRTRQRQRIVDLLKDYQHLGYLGDYRRDNNLFLYPHWEALDCQDINQLVDRQIPTSHDMETIKSTNLWGYSPPHNLYYQDTFISIYGETVEHGTSIAVTEKTYDPLIKGHFILPFSCMGLVSHLRSLGFRFPDFINYSYDDEASDEKRFGMYSDEIKRLLDIDIGTWRTHWHDNIDIIMHNQKIFHDRPYDRIDFSRYL